MLTETARGTYTIAATPFRPDGALDLDGIAPMVAFYEKAGADGLTILGMMGEAGKLSAEEAVAVIDAIIARTRLPIIVGVSAPGLAALRTLAGTAMDKGAAGVMVAPTANLRSDDQIIQYFQMVAETLGETPWVLQDFPLATGVQMTASVVRRIFDACPTAKMLKHEDWPGLEKISALRQDEANGARRVSILCGNGGQFLLEEMQRGADGAMTGFAYPEMMRDVIAHGVTDPDHARVLFEAYLPLIRYECQPGLGLAIRKYILARRGALPHATVRRPGPSLSATTIAEIEALIARQTERLAAL